MKIKTLVVNEFQVNAYILHDDTNQAVIIDGAVKFDNEIQELKSYILDNQLEVKYILNTHGHVDHISGNNLLKSLYNVPILMNYNDNFLIESAVMHAQSFGLNVKQPPMPDMDIIDGMTIEFGKSNLQCIEVPGHSPGSIAFYNKLDEFVITGDALFAGSIGRTDLPKGNYDKLINSIKTKILNLPENTRVFCGHGPETDIAAEKWSNPFLK